MKEILEALETIEKSVNAGKDPSGVQAAIQSARKSLAGAMTVGARHAAPLHQLDDELSVWQTKLNVILKERIGREGIAKHARHWVEELRRLHVR